VTLVGVVQDAVTRGPITGATVTIAGTSTTTSAGGLYTVTVAMAAVLHGRAIAAGYVSTLVDIYPRNAQLYPIQRFDFTGPLGLRPVRTAVAEISGVVQDARTGLPIPGAAVSVPGTVVRADGAGHYQLTVHAAAHLELAATALGYRASPWLPLVASPHDVLHGPLIVNFTGRWALHDAFHTTQGDTWQPMSQMAPAGTKELAFSLSTHSTVDPAFGVIAPNGDAVLLPLSPRAGVAAGRLSTDRGTGIYRIEILDGSGLPLFALPIYVGVPYMPVFPPTPDPPDASGATVRQLEAQVFSLLNGMRARYHRPSLLLDLRVAAAARAHSADVAAHASLDQHPHSGSDGSTPPSRIGRAGVMFGQWAETVAVGSSMRDAVAALLASPWHRAIMLSPEYRQVGIGVARRTDGTTLVTIDYLQPFVPSSRGATSGPPPAPAPLRPVLGVGTVLAGPHAPAVLSIAASAVVASGGVAGRFTQRLQVLVPAGAVDQPTLVQARLVPLGRLPAAPQAAGEPNNAALGFAFDLRAASVSGGHPLSRFNPRHPLVLVTTYRAADLGALAAATLHLTYFDPGGRRWRTLPTTVDPLRHTLVAATTHFTLFQVRGTARTPAQVRQARARQAALAAAGPPVVSAVPVTPARLGGEPLLVTMPVGRQRAAPGRAHGRPPRPRSCDLRGRRGGDGAEPRPGQPGLRGHRLRAPSRQPADGDRRRQGEQRPVHRDNQADRHAAAGAGSSDSAAGSAATARHPHPRPCAPGRRRGASDRGHHTRGAGPRPAGVAGQRRRHAGRDRRYSQ
jgi:uncharacterized protein YkwD